MNQFNSASDLSCELIPVEAVPVLPLGKLGGRLGRMTKGGAKITKQESKTHQKLPQEGRKTCQNWPKWGANLIDEEVL